MSDTFNFILIFISVALILWIIIYAIFFNRRSIVKRKMKKTPLKRISDVYENDLVRITGKVELFGDAMTSPLSGRRCGYYHIHVEQKVSNGKSSNWRTVIDEEVPGYFLIREGRHCAIISDNRIKTYLIQDKTFRSGTFNDADENLNNYLQQKGHSSTGFFGMNKTMRYKEGILEEGEQIAVAGIGKWIYLDASHPLHGQISESKVLEISSMPETGFVYLSDDPKLVALPNNENDERNEFNYQR
jgi:hypothetical protein